MASATAAQWKEHSGKLEGPVLLSLEQNSVMMSPRLVDFRRSCETFVDSLMREWKTLNVVSVLLLSVTFTFFIC